MARIFIAMPIYKSWGMDPRFPEPHPETNKSLEAQKRAGPHAYGCYHIIGDSTMCRARGTLFAQFLKGDNGIPWDYLWILDDDVTWPNWAPHRLIARDKPLIGVPYPFKDGSNRMVCRALDGERPRPDGTLLVKYLNGGFMFIRRDLLERMVAAYPELEYRTNHTYKDGDLIAGGERTFNLWGEMLYPNEQLGGMELLSEDWTFSQRAMDLPKRDGGPPVECWADCTISLGHWSGNDEFRFPMKETPQVVTTLEQADRQDLSACA